MRVYFFTIYLRFNDSKRTMAWNHAEIAYSKEKARMCIQLYAQQLAHKFNATIINLRYDRMEAN